MPSQQVHPSSHPRSGSVAVDRRAEAPVVSRPKALFLLAATLSFLMSVYLFFSGDHERGIFVGIWVPSILAAGALLLGKEDRHD
ncbi:MAG TPA: hypothetical protein VII72_21945 [Myxococcota bacterium]|jgi:hypothetical protein